MTALLTLAKTLGIDPGPLNQTELQEQTCSKALAEIQHWRDQLDKTCEEGCTPADAEKLKDFNAQLAYENFDLKNERDSLAAQVERLLEPLKTYRKSGFMVGNIDEIISETPRTALESIKNQWQVDAVEVVKNHFERKFNRDDKFTAEWIVDLLCGYMSHLGQRAQEAGDE